MTPTPDPRFAKPRTLFFGIGAQKSATSWLHKHLREHPEICLPVRKEQHYWTTRLQPRPCARHAWAEARLDKIGRRGLFDRLTRSKRGKRSDEAWRMTEIMLRHDDDGSHSDYADVLFQVWDGQPVLGEITPEYALLDAPQFVEMAALGQDVRFIMIMRDPLDRLRSGCKQFIRKSRSAADVTPENVAAQLRLSLSDLEDPAMLRSRYDMTIERLERVIPRDKVLYLFFETMFRQSEMDRVTDFLGVGRMSAPVDKKVHEGVGGKIEVGDDLKALAAEALRPTYDFVHARFGALTPDAWWVPEDAERPVATQAARM